MKFYYEAENRGNKYVYTVYGEDGQLIFECIGDNEYHALTNFRQRVLEYSRAYGKRIVTIKMVTCVVAKS